MRTTLRANVALGLVFALSLLTGVVPSQAQQNVDVDPTPIVVGNETIEPAENEQPVDEPTSDELSQAESEEPVSEPASDEISSEPEGSAIVSEPEGPEHSSASVSTGDVEAGLFALPTGRNYLTWKVTDAGGNGPWIWIAENAALPCVGVQNAHQHAQRRGLARAVGAKHAKNTALRDRQRHIIHGQIFAEILSQSFGNNDGFGHDRQTAPLTIHCAPKKLRQGINFGDSVIR